VCCSTGNYYLADQLKAILTTTGQWLGSVKPVLENRHLPDELIRIVVMGVVGAYSQVTAWRCVQELIKVMTYAWYW
jgi:hypothetical protein